MKIKYITLVSLLVLCFSVQCSSPTSENQSELDKPPPESASKITPAMAEGKPGVQRIVAFKFKDGTSQEAIQQHMDDFAALEDSIPQILSYRAGETLSTSYEATGDYDVLHYATYESETAVEEYFNHPAHQRFIERNKAHWEQVIVLNSKVE